MNLRYESLSKDNLEQGLLLGKIIFPHDYETLELAYKASLNLLDPRWGTRKIIEYYLVYDEHDKLVAITGLYQWNDHAEDEVWLGWYGVSPKERGRGIGREVLNWTIQKAKKRGYRKFRLWTTTSEDEVIAQKLYESIGLKVYKEEENKKDGYTILYREMDL